MAIGRENLLGDERFQTNAGRVEHVDALETELEATLQDRTVAEWESLLVEEHKLPVGLIWIIDQALDSDQLASREIVKSKQHTDIGSYPLMNRPLNHMNATHGFEQHAPVLGGHTEEILRDLNYSNSEIKQMQSNGVIGGEERV